MYPKDWKEEGEYGYSPERYDPETYNYKCKKCGTRLHRGGDRSGGVTMCPGCDVIVHSY